MWRELFSGDLFETLVNQDFSKISRSNSLVHLLVHYWLLVCINDAIKWFYQLQSWLYDLLEGSLEVKLPTILTDEKQRWEELETRREEERRSEKRKSQKKEDAGAREGRKVAKHCVFTMICRKSARRCGAKHISKSKCTKHAILGPLLEVAMSKKLTPLWREEHFQVKSVKN